ncbi:MAG: stage II sporulation protein P, partial [Erysipelotrichaceae bacterium]
MKDGIKLFIKIIIILLFLIVTPFFKELSNFFAENSRDNKLIISLKDIEAVDNFDTLKSLNVMSVKELIRMDEETIMFIPSATKPNNTNKPATNKKKIYIYNTHQQEGYSDTGSVMEAAALLSNELVKLGYEVVLETNDFNKYANDNNLNYNQLYLVSSKYLNDAFVNYKGFDLVIDLHRDSIPRNLTYYTEGKLNYAKMMLVVGGLSDNSYDVTKTSATLTDIINKEHNGMMRSVMNREAYYNQQMFPKMILIELGSDANTFDEV